MGSDYNILSWLGISSAQASDTTESSEWLALAPLASEPSEQMAVAHSDLDIEANNSFRIDTTHLTINETSPSEQNANTQAPLSLNNESVTAIEDLFPDSGFANQVYASPLEFTTVADFKSNPVDLRNPVVFARLEELARAEGLVSLLDFIGLASRVGTEQSKMSLRTLAQDSDDVVKSVTWNILIQNDTDFLEPLLIKEAQQGTEKMRFKALELLASARTIDARNALINIAGLDPNVFIQANAIKALGHFNDDAVLNFLKSFANHPESEVRLAVASALQFHVQNPQSHPLIQQLIYDENKNVSSFALRSLQPYLPENFIDPVLETIYVEERSISQKAMALIALGNLPTQDNALTALAFIRHPAREMRYASALALAKILPHHANIIVPALLDRIQFDADISVVEESLKALGNSSLEVCSKALCESFYVLNTDVNRFWTPEQNQLIAQNLSLLITQAHPSGIQFLQAYLMDDSFPLEERLQIAREMELANLPFNKKILEIELATRLQIQE